MKINDSVGIYFFILPENLLSKSLKPNCIPFAKPILTMTKIIAMKL